MTELLRTAFSPPWSWLLLAAGALLAIIAYIRHDSFLLTDLTYRFPLVGKLARFSRDYSETKRGGWLNVEASLCHDYARHVTALSKVEFERNIEYLRKAYDHGRRPMPLLVLALLTVLVLLEGLGFSYLLGSWMAMDSSENERMWLALAIVIVIAAILLWVTHTAGHQLYRTRLLRSCFQQFQASTMHPASRKDEPKIYTSGIVSLSQDQSIDKDQPSHVWCANRVVTRPDDLGSYAWVWLAAALIVIIAVVSVILRIETLHSIDLLGAELMPNEFQDAIGAAAGNPAAAAARESAALASFAILSTIFIVTQMVGVGVGFWYSFAGKQSREAYNATHGCADYDTYFQPIRRRMSIADLRLTTLHRLMEKRLPHEINWTRDFLTFVREERARGATDLQDPANLDPPPATAPPSGGNGAHHGTNSRRHPPKAGRGPGRASSSRPDA
jgi:hypothetical protein